jgi:NADH dehydrogenase
MARINATMTAMLRPHVVILGAGFGGTYVGKKLARSAKAGEIDLTIVNRTNYFLFTPLLHEVATGSLSPRSVAEPLREIFVHTGTRIIQGAVDSIDLEKQVVKIAPPAGGGPSTSAFPIEYDYLVIATGAETNYYGIPGAERLALPLKSLSDAARIRNRVIDAFEAATLTIDKDERARLLSFVIVGGGPTGVEVASELAELVSGMVKRYFSDTKDCEPTDPRNCSPEEPSIALIDSGPEILSMFDAKLRKKAAERLTNDGVSILENTKVAEVTPAGLKLAPPAGGGSTLSTGTVIWAAGVKPVIPHFEGDLPAGRPGRQPELIAGRLAVNEFFQLKGQSRVFVLGDVAGYVDSHSPARALPQLAQVAVSEARVVADNIQAAINGKELKDLHFHSKGTMVSVGQWFAVGKIFGVNIAGPLTWWMWRTVYLFKFASPRKRIRIALEWAFELISPRDITKM